MQPDKIHDLLAQEYATVQRFIEDFDARALTIKAWSVTFSAAGLGLAYVQNEPLLLLVAAGSALVFWLTETLWKVHQRAYFPRVEQIEAHFADGAKLTAPLQIAASWSRAFHGDGGWRAGWKILFLPHVMLPHLLVAAAGVALYCFMPPG